MSDDSTRVIEGCRRTSSFVSQPNQWVQSGQAWQGVCVPKCQAFSSCCTAKAQPHTEGHSHLFSRPQSADISDQAASNRAEAASSQALIPELQDEPISQEEFFLQEVLKKNNVLSDFSKKIFSCCKRKHFQFDGWKKEQFHYFQCNLIIFHLEP